MSKTTYESLDNKIAASTLTKDLTKGLDVVDGHGIKKPGEYENPDKLYDMLIARIRKYHPSTDVSMIEKAYALAKEAHGDQCRKSGEPYIVHPLWVAIILANLEMDFVMIRSIFPSLQSAIILLKSSRFLVLVPDIPSSA